MVKKLPAFWPQIQFDQLVQYFLILPCPQALAALPQLGHQGLPDQNRIHVISYQSRELYRFNQNHPPKLPHTMQ